MCILIAMQCNFYNIKSNFYNISYFKHNVKIFALLHTEMIKDVKGKWL